MTVISERVEFALHRLSIIVAMVLLALCARVEAAWADCGQAMTSPVVSVRAPVRAAIYDLGRGIGDLTNDLSLAVPRGLEDFKYAFGVTAVETKGTTRWELNGMPNGNGGMCWWVTNLQITITAYTKVYIAKEVPRDSCLWQQVTVHEARHVKMDQKMFPRLPDIVRPRVVRQVSRSLPAANQAAANALWSKIISQTIGEGVQEFRAQRDAAQLTIDTREEYTRASRACGNVEVAAALNRAGMR